MSPSPDPLARRLRSAPALRVVALAFGTVLTALLAIVVLTTAAAATARFSPLPAPIHQAVVGLPVVVGLYAVGRRFVLQAPSSWFMAGRPDRRLLRWVLVGLGCPAGLLVASLVGLDATVEVRPLAAPDVVALAAAALASGLLAGVLEELAFRGALLRLLEARWGKRIALGGSSATFAVLHQGHADTATDLGLVLAATAGAGLFLGVIALRTRSVWNAVAVHAGWNAVFGGFLVAVGPAGTPLPRAVVHARLTDPGWWFAGVHGGLDTAPATTVVLVVAAAAVHRLTVAVPGGRSAVADRRLEGERG